VRLPSGGLLDHGELTISIQPVDGHDRGKSSTWQSITRGVTHEIDFLHGEIVLLARKHGLAAATDPQDTSDMPTPRRWCSSPGLLAFTSDAGPAAVGQRDSFEPFGNTEVTEASLADVGPRVSAPKGTSSITRDVVDDVAPNSGWTPAG
jgi:hypothetical protein